jgi:hypothetical protein
VAGRVGVHPVPGRGAHLPSGTEERGADRERELVRFGDVVNEDVEMHLLRLPVGPLRWDVIRGELKRQLSFAVDGDGVPSVVRTDGAAEQTRPERTLLLEVGRVDYE